MKKEKILKIIEPSLNKQTLYHLGQINNYIDSALREVITHQFESPDDKIKYLANTMTGIRDYTLAVTNENSLRISLINEYLRAEKEEELGNDLQLQEENKSGSLEELPEQDQLN